MILIAAYSSEGCEARCDSRCYNSKKRRCSCICGSANHGAGLERATENTRALADTWIAQFDAALPQPVGEAASGQAEKETPHIRLRWDVPARIAMRQQALDLPLFSFDAIGQPSEGAAL